MFDLFNDLLTVSDVGALLRICPSRVYDILKSGELKGFQFKRAWRIKKEDLIEYINNQIECN